MFKAANSRTDHEAEARWREWINLRANLSWVYDGPVSTPNLRGDFSPDHSGAWLIKRGTVLLRQEGKTVTAGAGEWLIPWPGYRYQEFSEGAEIVSVRFRAAWPDGRPLFDRGLSFKLRAADHPQLLIAAEELLRATKPIMLTDPVLLDRVPVTFDRFIEVNVAFLQWLRVLYATLCAAGIKPSRLGILDERIVAALQKLDGQLFGQPMRERVLAAEVGLGVSQFVRLFRQELGETPKQYSNRRRRDYCREMLTGSSMPIKELAFSLGFERLSDFSAWFKHQYGMAPRTFRAGVRRSIDL